MRDCISGLSPIPVSLTRKTSSSPSRSAARVMRPPRSEYLAALFKRFATTMLQPGRISEQPYRLAREGHRELMTLALHETLLVQLHASASNSAS